MLAMYLSVLESGDDKEAFTALYENCMARALYLAQKIVTERATAEDAVHMGFLYLAEHYQRLKKDYPQGLEGYFYQCVESRALDLARKQARETGGAEETLLAAESREAGPERQAVAADRLERAVAAVRELPDIYRVTLELYCTGWALAEIAETTGVSPETAYKRLERARQMVRKKVGEDDE